MSDLHIKTAGLLDAMADAEDERAAHAATAASARDGAALATKLAGAIGGDVPDDVRQKLAADPSLRSYLAPLLERTASFEAPRALGGPSEKSAAPGGRLSPDEELAQANAHFVNVVMGRGNG